MTPDRALITELKSAGVTLRLDGDAIVHRGPRNVLSPDVLAKLRQNKGEIVTELQRQAKISSPCVPDIVAALDRLPVPRDHSGRRLIAETRKFLKSPWWTEAIECGWTLEELYGVDETAPMDYVDRWGMIVGLALAPRRGDAIEHLDAQHAVIRYFAGTPLNSARRIERRSLTTASSVVWWECAAIVGDAEGLTAWNS